MDQLKPTSLAIVAGGVLVLIASFLDWFLEFSAYESAIFGLTGFFLLLIALICIVVPLLGALAPQVTLPERIVGLSRNQVLHALGFAVLVLSFSLLFREDSAKIGTILALVGSIAIVAGSHLEHAAET